MSETLYVFVDETGTPSFSKKNKFFGIQAICITEAEYKASIRAARKRNIAKSACQENMQTLEKHHRAI